MYFGTDGIRNVAEFFDDKFLQKTADALAGVKGLRHAVIGRDTRTSGEFISAVLSKKLADKGVKITDIGVAPTPLVSFYTKYIGADMGIVISASHNPPEYNGIKIFNKNGEKPDGREEAEIEYLMDHSEETEREPSEVLKDTAAEKAYAEYIGKKIRPLDGLKIALDCANGATGKLAPAVFEALGAEVSAFKRGTTGADINDNCGATSLEFIKDVTAGGTYDIGFAFDGDGDRVIAVKDGKVYDGDWEMCVLAVAGGFKTREVVGTVMTNTACEKYLRDNGLKLIRTRVGDKYVWEEMKRGGASVGGEKAGHIILSELATTGDGIAVAAALAEAYKTLGGKWVVPHDYPEISLTLPATAEQKAAFEKSGIAEEVSAEAKDKGIRLVVRPSGTEPKIRITAEAESAERAESFAKSVETKIREVIK